ncbi:sodium:calcium antiporter [Hydrocarboniclastica marina]|uniref:Sodium:calcium antiporter n=1 Tax=Hydrocarboniclastica marina TaxID=2259620 RepID=A0A4P7XJT1_9ALTE|nr:sodium:calcium antiporter [Hydrocarboniclastica marina]MAL96924.1 cation transporter [Alteromonadaceae bacterium]QCF26137.1 sodium:calcium antiporter [Hydrocarboniclastica marina]
MAVFSPDSWTLLQSSLVFAACAVVIGVLGTRLTRIVDQLADRTGLGEAIAGAVLLGASTSLSGAVLSVTAAWKGHAELSVSNALGGIAVQTLFLAVADIFYRRANLEHAAASAPNMLQNALLMSLLAIILLAPTLPDVTVWGVHPVTPILFCLYIYGIKLVKGARLQPMWNPSITRETRDDVPEDEDATPALPRLVIEFLILISTMGFAGWILEPAASNIAARTGLGQTIVGVLFTATSTSLPELVTSIAAVRRGALTLAVGGIVGGNAFDTLFTAASDIAYRDGSIYHAMSEQAVFWVSLSLVMTSFLMMGLIRRQEQGLGGIGAESVALIVVYGLGVGRLFIS